MDTVQWVPPGARQVFFYHGKIRLPVRLQVLTDAFPVRGSDRTDIVGVAVADAGFQDLLFVIVRQILGQIPDPLERAEFNVEMPQADITSVQRGADVDPMEHEPVIDAEDPARFDDDLIIERAILRADQIVV